MKQFNKLTLICGLMLIAFTGNSQLDMTGQYKVRPEMSNGYQRPLLSLEQPSFYIAQRARLGAIYTQKKFQFKLSLQDVRTWGNTSNIAVDDNGYLSVFQANLSLYLNKKWTVKMGRQTISYDNERIFGSLDWLMQSRRHDAAIVKFRDKKWSIDVGAAYNSERPSSNQIIYELNNYKTFQYVWANKEWDKLKASVLILNNGLERIYLQDGVKKGEINYSQTLGAHFEYKRTKLDVVAYGYYQMGTDTTNRQVSAYNASIQAKYKPNEKLQVTLGGEILSGTTQEVTTDNTNRSFSPLYGTNHDFNGYMDFFYNGNHENNVGLIDGFLKGDYKTGKFTFGLANHFFFAASPVVTEITTPNTQPAITIMDPFLGYEADFTIKYQFIDEVVIELGYSQLFGTPTMQTIKGTDNNRSSNWVYLMVTAKPFKNFKLFK